MRALIARIAARLTGFPVCIDPPRFPRLVRSERVAYTSTTYRVLCPYCGSGDVGVCWVEEQHRPIVSLDISQHTVINMDCHSEGTQYGREYAHCATCDQRSELPRGVNLEGG